MAWLVFMTGSRSQNRDSLACPHYYNMPGEFIQFPFCVPVAAGIVFVFMGNPDPESAVPTTERSKVQRLLLLMYGQRDRRQLRNRQAGISGLSKLRSQL